MALSALVVIAALSVLGYSMQHSTQSARASGVGGGDPCYSATGSTPSCHFKGFTAEASYSNVDQTTCASGVYTYYSVYATDNVVTNPSNAASGPLVSVFYGTWNNCSSTYSSYGATVPAAIQTTGELGSASLQATVPLHDWSNNPGPTLTVNLTWTGFGPLSTTVEDMTTRTGDSVFKSRFTGTNRMAQATGTISDGTTTVNINTTTTMFDAKGGTISIEHA
jgi:hypothetical protein